MKFITPVSMPCTKEQYEADLKKPLEEMGYTTLINDGMWDNKDFQYLETLTGLKACQNFNIYLATWIDNYFIPTYNPELFLALAAMTYEPMGIKGEWWRIGDALYRSEGEPLCSGCFPFPRKATKEEIIKHFDMKNKQDLREFLQSGNIVEFSDGETGIVIDTLLGKLIQFGNLCGKVEDLNEDLGYFGNPTLKIVRIRKINFPQQIIPKYFPEAPIIWERKEKRVITVSELLKMAGIEKDEVTVEVDV